MRKVTQMKRFNKAIEVLERPEEFSTQWDMSVFGQIDTDDQCETLPVLKCNTAACFAGTLSLDTYFRRLGFVGQWNLDLGDLSLKVTKNNDTGSWITGLANLLGVTENEANSLISPCTTELDSEALQEQDRQGRTMINITPKRVILRLRRLIERYAA